jgi:group I intron endonuclease
MVGIYKIENLVNGKVYIGKSKDIERRWKQHKKNMNKPERREPIYFGLRKYGIENFSFEILKECPKEDLNDFECFYIRLYCSWNRKYGYNVSLGGDSNNYCFDETKEKISKKLKGKSYEELYGKEKADLIKKHMSEKRKGHPNYRTQPYTQEQRNKIRETQIGKNWYTNGKDDIKSLECPVGFYRGRSKTRGLEKGGKTHIGKIYFNNGLKNVKCLPENMPDGFVKGKIQRPANKGMRCWTNGIEIKYGFECPGIDFNLGRKIKKE